MLFSSTTRYWLFPLALKAVLCAAIGFGLSACGDNSQGTPNLTAAPIDSDDDGITNDSDNCPTDPNANQSDSDDDGFGDACDQCSGTDANASVDNNGCANNQLDSDNDGVADDVDQCPGTPDNTAVDNTGCPDANADSDMDGINDAQDVCPDSVLTDSNGSAFEFFSSGCPKVTLTRDGISYDVFLSSDVDGERVAFTVHEPHTVTANGTYPMIGHAHGYSQSRTSNRPATGATSVLGRLLDNDYGAYSMDQRGHGQSGGQIRLLDPEVEGQDMLHILDWLTTNISWLEFEDANQTDYVMGSYGSSYGGGYQHTLLRLDPLHRLDAMVPDITWNDLRYSISTNGVFKTKWALFLSGVAQSTPGGHHDDVNNGLQRGIEEGDINDEEKRLLYRSSMAYNCDGTNTGDVINRASTGTPMDVGRPITAIPALYTQGPSDTLFDLTDAFRNYRCLQQADNSIDVRLFTQPFGHDNLTGAGRCGGLNTAEITIAFFDFHLKGNNTALDNIPSICIDLRHTDNNDAAVQRTAAEGFPYGNDGNNANDFDASLLDPITSTPIPFTFSEANASVQNVAVYTAQADGEILAGIPTMELAITRSPGADNIDADAIVFVGIAISTDGGATFRLPNQISTGTGQTTPFKDRELDANTTQELAGITATLSQGDIVAVQYAARDIVYQNSGTRVPGITGTITGTVHLPLLGVRGTDISAFSAP